MTFTIIDATGMTAIDKPGIYANLAAEVYHSNCTPTPSLSSSGARGIVADCPAYFWHHSPLNPNRPVKDSKAFDIGTASHLITLEPHLFDAGIEVISVPKKAGGFTDDYKTDAAQEARDAARAAGKVPLLPKERAMVIAMRAALRLNPIASQAFNDGHVELSIFWQDEQTGVWCKARPDFLHASCAYWCDYKTTTTAHPEEFARKAYALGYHAQDAWLTDAVEQATGIKPRTGWFVCQDKEEPYLATTHRFPPEAVELGRMINRKGIDLFAQCLRSNEWPNYRQASTPTKDTAFIMELPGYLIRQLETQES